MVDITAPQQTFFSMGANPGKSILWESRKVHPLTKRLFLPKSAPDVRLAGKLKNAVGVWMRTT